jgi:transketolase N-terminal domain/subunit
VLELRALPGTANGFATLQSIETQTLGASISVPLPMAYASRSRDAALDVFNKASKWELGPGSFYERAHF